MPCIEILQLQVRPGISPSDPDVLGNMIKVRTALREQVHNTRSRVYQDIQDPSLIYIFGEWPSLQDHQDFTSSPLKDKILSLQGGQTQFKWMLHINVAEGIAALPWASRVMAISRLKGVDQELILKENVLEGHENSLCAWRIDGEENMWERIVLSGWDSQEDHIAFITGMSESSNTDRSGDRLVMYATDMEK